MDNKYLVVTLGNIDYLNATYLDFIKGYKLKENLQSIETMEKIITKLNGKKNEILKHSKSIPDELKPDDFWDYYPSIIAELKFIETYLPIFFADVLCKNFPCRIKQCGIRMEVYCTLENKFSIKLIPQVDVKAALNQVTANQLTEMYSLVEALCDCAVRQYSKVA